MRIVTRPDFDGIVCAVLIRDAEGLDIPVAWAEPGEIQTGKMEIRSGDIIANLPYDTRCSLWFDHHYTNKPQDAFKGAFKIAPSAASVVYEYYRNRIKSDFDELVAQTDRIDQADLTEDEIRYPEKYPYVLLSMTITDQIKDRQAYWETLVDLLGRHPIDEIMRQTQVAARCRHTVDQNKAYETVLLQHTVVEDQVAITDLRQFDPVPSGNRFLIYTLFPQAVVQVKIRRDEANPGQLAVSVGHSITNRNCNVNVGLLLSQFNGGGHRGAGACRFPIAKTDQYLPKIIETLKQNKPNEPTQERSA